MKVKNTPPPASMKVRADCDSLTSRAGTALLVGVADRVGPTGAVQEGPLRSLRGRRGQHQPGRILRDLAGMLGDGGDALCDLGALRDQEVLFGPVASDATAWRLIAALDEEHLARVREARASARQRVWELAEPPKRLILDIDATLVTAHSEKEGAAGTYKGGFGFHPLLCFEATSGEALAGVLRPGNAGSNTASDHIEVLARALLQLPAGAVNPGTLVRCDSGGATHAFTDAVVQARLSFSVGFDLTEYVRRAILSVPESAWVPALGADGGRRATGLGSRNWWIWTWPPRTGPRARAPSVAGSGPTPGRNSPSVMRRATASRSSSPIREAAASRALNRSTAPGRLTRSQDPFFPAQADC